MEYTFNKTAKKQKKKTKIKKAHRLVQIGTERSSLHTTCLFFKGLSWAKCTFNSRHISCTHNSIPHTPAKNCQPYRIHLWPHIPFLPLQTRRKSLPKTSLIAECIYFLLFLGEAQSFVREARTKFTAKK